METNKFNSTPQREIHLCFSQLISRTCFSCPLSSSNWVTERSLYPTAAAALFFLWILLIYHLRLENDIACGRFLLFMVPERRLEIIIEWLDAIKHQQQSLSLCMKGRNFSWSSFLITCTSFTDKGSPTAQRCIEHSMSSRFICSTRTRDWRSITW